MTTHYETLGVMPDATLADIRAAFRRKATEHHPDKGGDDERMQAVNEAYQCLKDADQRARYDAGEHAPRRDSAEEEASRKVVELLDGLFESEELGADVLLNARAVTVRLLNDSLRAMNKTLAVRIRLTKHVGRTRRKSGTNLVQGVLDRKLAQVDEALSKHRRRVAVCEAMAAILNDHETTA